jgi:hypothetical protein
MADHAQVSNAAWPSYCSRMCATSPCARVDERADALHSTSLAQVLCLLLSFSIDDRAELLHRRSSLLQLSWPWRCTFPSQARRSFLCSWLLRRPAIVLGPRMLLLPRPGSCCLQPVGPELGVDRAGHGQAGKPPAAVGRSPTGAIAAPTCLAGHPTVARAPPAGIEPPEHLLCKSRLGTSRSKFD